MDESELIRLKIFVDVCRVLLADFLSVETSDVCLLMPVLYSPTPPEISTYFLGRPENQLKKFLNDRLKA